MIVEAVIITLDELKDRQSGPIHRYGSIFRFCIPIELSASIRLLIKCVLMSFMEKPMPLTHLLISVSFSPR